MQGSPNLAHQIRAKVIPPVPSFESWIANYLAVQAFIDSDVGISLSQIKSLPMFVDMPSAAFARLIDGLVANGGIRLVRFQTDTLVVVDESFVEQQLQSLTEQLDVEQRLKGVGHLFCPEVIN